LKVQNIKKVETWRLFHSLLHTGPARRDLFSQENYQGSKTGSRNNKEITKRDNSGDRKFRKEIRSHRC
jgi:tRNA G37 N-methylase TrmD